MRFWAPLLAFAAVAFAQNNQINTPNGGFGATAGQSITITWTNPSSGNVDIRLTQGNNIQPGSGTLLISNVPASAETATFTLPDGSSLNGQQYNFEIVPQDSSAQPNFSSGFVVSGASGTGSSSASGSSSMTMTDSSSSASASGSSTSTGSSSATTTDSNSSSSAAATSSSSNSASMSSSATAVTTTAAHNMGAGSAQIGGVLAMVAGAIAVF